MGDLQFNYSIDGSITVMLDDDSVGYISDGHYASRKGELVKAEVCLDSITMIDQYYSTVGEAKEDIEYYLAAYFDGL